MFDGTDHDDGLADAGSRAKLAADLRRLRQSTASEIDPAIDASIRDEIRNHFAKRRFGRSQYRNARPWFAVAAAVLLALSVWAFTLSLPRAGSPAIAQRNPADVDRNGAVDILDAFALARHLKVDVLADTSLDFNGDGTIDQRDVDVIAMQAVSLAADAAPPDKEASS